MAEIKTVMTADTSQFESAMKRAQGTAKSSTTGMQRGFSGLSSSIGSMASTAVKAGSVITLAFYAIKSMIGSNLDAARYSFDKLAKAAQVDSKILMDSLRAASNSAVADFDLMQSASRGMLLGLNPQAIVRFMEIATAASKATGDSITKSFEDIVLGSARQSKLILDNLGIIIKLDEANAAYAKTLGIAASEMTDAMKKQAFLNAVMAAGDEQIKVLGSDTAGTFNETAKLVAKLKNIWDEFSTVILQTLNSFSAVGNLVLNTFSKIGTKLSQMITTGSIFSTVSANAFGASEITYNKPNSSLGPAPDLPKGGLNGHGDRAIKKQAEEAKKVADQIKKINEELNRELNIIDDDTYSKKIEKAKEHMNKQLELSKGDAELKIKIEKAYNKKIEEINTERASRVRSEISQIEQQGMKNNYDIQLTALKNWHKEMQAITVDNEELRQEIDNAYNQRTLELNIEFEETMAKEIASIKDTSRLTQEEAELEQLDEWHERMLELTIDHEEAKIAVEEAYAERRREIKATQAEHEVSVANTLYTNMGAISEKTAQFEIDVQRSKFGVLNQLGKIAVEQGGEMGKKIFLVTQSVAAAEAIVNTHAAVMKTMASVPYPLNIPLAAAQAAIGAAHVASIMSTAIGAQSSPSAGAGGGGGVPNQSSSSLYDLGVDKRAQQGDEKEGNLTIVVYGDMVSDDEYIDKLAYRLSESVQSRNIILKSSQAREIGN